MKTWRSVAVLAVLGLAATGCGDDGSGGGGSGGGGISGGAQPRMEVFERNNPLSNGGKVLVSPGAAAAGTETKVTSINIINTGNAPLRIAEIAVTSVPEGVFRVQPQGSAPAPVPGAPVSIESQDAEEGLRTYWVDLLLTVPAGGPPPTATISLRTNSKINEAETFVFTVETEGAAPEIQVTPTVVDFANVGQGESKPRTFNILNTGAGDLEVTGFTLTGHPAFALLRGAQEYPVSPETATPVTFDEALTVAAGTSEPMTVRFSPEGPEGAEANLVLFSNDPTAQSGTVVRLVGNQTGPCISITPKKVDFGGKLIGNLHYVEVEVLSCGESPLTLSTIELDPESSTDFALDLTGMPGVADGTSSLGEGDTPVVLDVNQTAIFRVSYVPDEINPLDGNGQPIPDLGTIHIETDAFVSELDVEVRGFGVEKECPTAVISVTEGEEVIPQTKLHLVGSGSYAASGGVKKYEWSVQQPVGSQSVFLPSASAPDPTFEVNVAGTYVFKLRVWDAADEESCFPAEYTVFVNPDEAIHVELLWHTPLDPDETDEGPEAGADLDLHFLHPFATGEDVDGDGKPDGWFDQPFDNFWFNPHPNWGSLDPMVDDDPGLDRDDTDGAGPENVNLNIPEDGKTYRVGVHYWNDHSFGPSVATVRVYIYSSLVFELDNVELNNLDMWEVATIAWPSGEVKLITDTGGSYRITPNYQHPFFSTD